MSCEHHIDCLHLLLDAQDSLLARLIPFDFFLFLTYLHASYQPFCFDKAKYGQSRRSAVRTYIEFKYGPLPVQVNPKNIAGRRFGNDR